MARTSRTQVHGCTAHCCTSKRLSDVPHKPDGVAWIAWAPHLTGQQIQRLTERWQRR